MPGIPATVCETLTRASACGYASGLIKMLSMTPKVAVVAPIPSANVTMTAAVKAGALRMRRSAWRVSDKTVSMKGSLLWSR